MDAAAFRNYCLSLPGAYADMPFAQGKSDTSRDIIVFYVAGKWFALGDLLRFEFCNLKSPPEDTERLTQTYAGIKPAWHMNKRHWVSVYFDADVADEMILQLVKKAYDTVVAKLPKREREKLLKTQEQTAEND